MPDLSDHDRAVLDFEDQHWKYAGAKEVRIREQFGTSATRFYQELNRLVDDPAALAYKPLLVKRLARLRDARRRQRSSSASRFEFS